MEIQTENDFLEEKRAFAVALLRTPKDPFKAALAVFGANVNMAMYAFQAWPEDPLVKQFVHEATNHHGEMHFLPSRASQAQELWQIANDPRLGMDERLKAHRLYADICGHIEQKGLTINNNVTTNKVMVVKQHASTDEWADKLAKQQEKLISDAQYSVVQ